MQYQRLFEILPYRQAAFGNDIVLVQKKALRWINYSLEEVQKNVESISMGLLKLEVNPRDKIAIMFPRGCPEWNFLDFGIMQIGGIVVPIHANVTDDELLFILNDAQIKYCITENRELYQKVENISSNIVSLKKVFTRQYHPDLPNWKELLVESSPKLLSKMHIRRAAIHEDDIATIVYTSGTTGLPKGVLLSHKNIITNMEGILQLLPLTPQKKTLSFLPISHISERVMLYIYLVRGMKVYYSNRKDTILKNLSDVKPNYLTANPRLLERVYDTILSNLNESSGWYKKIFAWAIELGSKYPDWKLSPFYWIQLQIAYLLVFRRLRRIAGRRIEGIIVAQGAVQDNIGRLFSAIGFNVREGYGLTETSAFITLNCFEPDNWMVGTVGIPHANVQLEIRKVDQTGVGEIYVKGDSVTSGYHNNPIATAQAFVEDEWFNTGDMGQKVEDQFLRITDRKRQVFLTAQGNRIYPVFIERLLTTSPYMEQCMVIGEGCAYLSCLIVPNWRMLQRWQLENRIDWIGKVHAAMNEQVQAFFQSLIQNFNLQLSEKERIQKFMLIQEAWTTDNQLLTPNHELRRTVIAEQYAQEIESLYA